MLEAERTAEARVDELVQAHQKSEEHAAHLQDELQGTNSQLAEAQSTLAKLVADLAEKGVQEGLHKTEKEALACLLSEKEKHCSELQRKVEDLEREIAIMDSTRMSTETERLEAQAKFEAMEAQLLLTASKEICEIRGDNEIKSKSPDTNEDHRVRSLEQKLASTSAKLAEAESKCEMLEQFIHEDSQGGFGVESSSESLFDILSLKGALREKDTEVERLRSVVKTTSEQLGRARKNVEELEVERALSQAKVSQLSATLEKRGDGEAERQLHQRSLELAEANSAKDQLKERLHEAEAVIKRLHRAVLEVGQGTEGCSDINGPILLNMKLMETEVKVDVLREKLTAAEKRTRELEQENEKLSRSSIGNSREGVGDRKSVV